MATKQLTAVAATKAKPRDKAYRPAAGGGLYLEVMPTGAKYWRWKYRHAGKEKRLAFGVFPEVSLVEAGERRTKARALLRGARSIRRASRAQARRTHRGGQLL